MATATTHLTTGWEPDLGDADSLSLAWVRHWADQVEAFARAAGGRTARDERYLLADYGRPASFFNSVVLLAPPDPAAFDELLGEIEARTAVGTGAVYLWSLWPTPDLRARGWELDGHPPLLIRAPGAVPDPPAGPQPVPVGSAAELAVWERIVVDGYPMPDLQPCRAGTAGRAGAARRSPLPVLDRPRRHRGAGDRDRPVHRPRGRRVRARRHVARAARARALGAAGRDPAARGAGPLGTSACSPTTAGGGAEQAGFVPVVRHTLWHRPR